MANKYLAREDAPFDKGLWEKLDQMLVSVARSTLSLRKLFSLKGPLGIGVKQVPGVTKTLEDGMVYSETTPLLWMEQTFSLHSTDLAAYERNPIGLDLSPLVHAVRSCAKREDQLLLNGAGPLLGLLKRKGTGSFSPGAWDSPGKAAEDLIHAVSEMDDRGFHGPFRLGLCPILYNRLLRRYPGGGNHTELDHAKTIVGGGVVKLPGLEHGGILIDTSFPGAFIVAGQDMSVGFVGPEGGSLVFSVSESITLQVVEPASITLLKGD
ncbi:MAG TPA: family 1 encapsulin nanocompartment shell protein [Thermotogota bacterium]|nr:family 1 encapsulin nanocompartment shell protein [Thermotogota bacterium]HRW92772.1 family 1 encapsulin nanocompartment shell protein [Thermotogota bacterium]